MNYSLYLQSGGSMQAPTSDEQALAHQKQVDNQMAEAIKQNPASLDQAIQEYGDDAPSFIKHMIDVAAENQDEQLLEILKPYAEKFNISAFRCGGKVRAKVKKAKCGKKMEKGGEAPIKKEAKGGKPCPCTLHKVGGKLIEVDCNGIPVAKNGTVLKFLDPSQPITYTRIWSGDTFTYNPTTRKFSYKSGYSTDASKRNKDYEEMSWEDLSKMKGSQDFAAKLYEAGYTNPADNVYFNKIVRGGAPTYEWGNVNRFNSGNYNGISYNNGVYHNGTTTLTDQQVYDLASKDPKMMDWLIGHNKYGYRGQEIDYNGGKAQWDPSKMKYVYKQPAATPTKSAGQLMFERANVGLSDYSLAGRQKWAKDNAEYLKTQGWDDARINSYKGSAVDNRSLLQAMQSKSALDALQTVVSQQPAYHAGRVDQKTGLVNSGWKGMSDDQLLNYKGSLFDLSNEELARQRALRSGEQQAAVNGTIRNGDEVYDNGVWHDVDDMSYLQGKTLQGVAPAVTLPRLNFSFQRRPLQYNPSMMRFKTGGKLNYANYLQ